MQTTSAQWLGCCHYFLRQQFFAAIEAAHFPDPKIDALQQSREGAPIHGDGLSRT